MQNESAIQATVIETSGSWYEVKLDTGKTIFARLQGKLRQSGLKLTNPVAVGDRVVLDNAEQEDSITIREILPRKNKIIRISPRKKHHYHIIASNIDQALVIISLSKPRTKMGFVNRVLVALEYYEIKPLLVFNKIDIYGEKEMKQLSQLEQDFQRIGYRTLRTSVKEQVGLDELNALTQQNINVLTGPSGVGKSSIANILNPALDLKTREVSSFNEKGMHTTTFSRMHELENGGYMIDTPGIKEYGVTEIDAYELSFYFPEMREAKDDCKFNNCQHIDEPKCAVKQAVELGEIAQWRYQSYVNIREELLVDNRKY